MLRLRALRANPAPLPQPAEVGDHDLLARGPSHMDMYDLKPEAPMEFRGEFKPINTNVTGVQICEHMPLQAAMWDKLACVRSLVSVDEHSDSLVMTGYSENTNRTAASSVLRLGHLETARQ